MPQLSTGLVIAGAYADKLRRVLFAQLRDKIKSKEIEGQEVAKKAGELNRILFEILVNKLKLDKGDAVRIRIEYDIKDGNIEWRLNTLQIEAFKRIPDDEVKKAVDETLKAAEEVLAKPVSAEEAAWTGQQPTAPKPELQAPPVKVKALVLLGKTGEGALFNLTGTKDEELGIVSFTPEDGKTRIESIIVANKNAYRMETVIDKPYEDVLKAAKENAKEILELLNAQAYSKISADEAKSIIREKLLTFI